MCSDGIGAVGCGPQEEFRACADVAIGDKGASIPVRPTRPGIKTTPRGKIIDATQTTTQPDVDTFADGTPRYVGSIIIALVALLFVLCCACAIYLYHYHGQRVKQLMHWNQHHKTPMRNTTTSGSPAGPPVAPPRTKRLSQTLNEINPYESSVLNGCSR